MTTAPTDLLGIRANVARTAAVAAALTASLDTSRCNSLRLDVNVVSFTAGTAPTATFTLQGLGADGTWYTLYATAAISAGNTATQSIGPGLTTAAMIPAAVRLVVSYGGTPTDGTWSASLIGRG